MNANRRPLYARPMWNSLMTSTTTTMFRSGHFMVTPKDHSKNDTSTDHVNSINNRNSKKQTAVSGPWRTKGIQHKVKWVIKDGGVP